MLDYSPTTDRVRLTTFLAVCTASIVALSCGGTAADNPASPSATTPRSVTVALVAVGTGYQGTAVAAFSDGSSREVTLEASWTSSNTDVATVGPSGQVTPVHAGSAEIRATYQAVIGAAALTVSAPPATPPASPPPPSSTTYTVSGSLRDALDNQSITDPDVCCLVELTTPSGELKKVQFSRDTFTFAGVAAGAVQISVKPYLGYAEQARQLTIAGNTVADFQLQPLPVLLGGEVLDARTEARAPRCTAKIEILTGPDTGRVTSTTVGPSYQFTERLQPATVTIRFSAPGGYETKERLVRLRGVSANNSMAAYASLACPGCALYSSMTCP